MIDLVTLDGLLGKKGGAGPAETGRNLDHFALQVRPLRLSPRTRPPRRAWRRGDRGRRTLRRRRRRFSLYIRRPGGQCRRAEGPERQASAPSRRARRSAEPSPRTPAASGPRWWAPAPHCPAAQTPRGKRPDRIDVGADAAAVPRAAPGRTSIRRTYRNAEVASKPKASISIPRKRPGHQPHRQPVRPVDAEVHGGVLTLGPTSKIQRSKASLLDPVRTLSSKRSTSAPPAPRERKAQAAPGSRSSAAVVVRRAAHRACDWPEIGGPRACWPDRG